MRHPVQLPTFRSRYPLFMVAFLAQQIMLQGCNRFLKWVGLERGNKPILGGPTLAGLPGGVVGDLQRLYPIRSNFEYPVSGVLLDG